MYADATYSSSEDAPRALRLRCRSAARRSTAAVRPAASVRPWTATRPGGGSGWTFVHGSLAPRFGPCRDPWPDAVGSTPKARYCARMREEMAVPSAGTASDPSRHNPRSSRYSSALQPWTRTCEPSAMNQRPQRWQHGSPVSGCRTSLPKGACSPRPSGSCQMCSWECVGRADRPLLSEGGLAGVGVADDKTTGSRFAAPPGGVGIVHAPIGCGGEWERPKSAGCAASPRSRRPVASPRRLTKGFPRLSAASTVALSKSEAVIRSCGCTARMAAAIAPLPPPIPRAWPVGDTPCSAPGQYDPNGRQNSMARCGTTWLAPATSSASI